MVVMNEVACDPGMKMTIPEYIVHCLFSSDCDITSLTQIPIYTICDGLLMNGSFPEKKLSNSIDVLTLSPRLQG